MLIIATCVSQIVIIKIISENRYNAVPGIIVSIFVTM